MALPITAREELESRLDVLGRDATRYREEANEYRAAARKLDEKAALHEERASELQGILERAFPMGGPVPPGSANDRLIVRACPSAVVGSTADRGWAGSR